MKAYEKKTKKDIAYPLAAHLQACKMAWLYAKLARRLWAYFYFDFTGRDLDKQSRRNLLSSLLVQLSVQSVVRASTAFILSTTMVHKSPVKPC